MTRLIQISGVIGLVGIILLTSCSSSDPFTASPELPLAPTVALRVGQTVMLSDPDVRFMFEQVTSDNRRVSSDGTITGTARLSVYVYGSGGTIATAILDLPGPNSELTVLNFHVKIVSLTPIPSGAQVITPSEYVGTFAFTQFGYL